MQFEKIERAKNREKSRLAIADRLFREGLYDEASKLRFCGEKFGLVCTCCGEFRDIEKSCKRRWCPDCSFIRGVALCEKYLAIVKKMRWPLMLTFTIPHRAGNDPVEMLELLKSSIKKLKRQKWWKDKIKGGIGAIEISGGGNGWHIHGHYLIECEWLSVVTKKPMPGMSRMAMKSCFKSSQREVAQQWAMACGHDEAFIWIKRADKKAIYEALKYCVKPGTFEAMKLPLRPLIEGFKNRRLVCPWGTVRKAARAVKIEDNEQKPKLKCACGEADWMTVRELDGHLRDARENGPSRERKRFLADQKKNRPTRPTGRRK